MVRGVTLAFLLHVFTDTIGDPEQMRTALRGVADAAGCPGVVAMTWDSETRLWTLTVECAPATPESGPSLPARSPMFRP